ncbi:MAG TPA: prolyl oligopeptidase family serine peptidase [Gammaproteobacteria bacterium]|jgi:dipeptidyl aminopeptidase/acylaminoacyl peptidase|nr:prolyl oligopeptidase family serine peptidase [Gammaproteobacteria bacterium]
MKHALPCGSWPSPLTVEQAAGAQKRFLQPRVFGDAIYWLEGRPEEGGRTVLVRHAQGHRHDLTPRPFDVRSRTHEYGGGAYAISAVGAFFCNQADQCIYKVQDGAPQRLTAPGARRYADLVPDLARDRLICVCEDLEGTPRDYLAAVSLTDGSITPLAEGFDFYGSPALAPDGSALAWLAWNHPQMPWDGCELWLAEIGADGALHEPRSIAGGSQESIFQPRWSPDGVLYFISDRTGYWNLYRYAGGDAHEACADPADYGYAQWLSGMSAYGFLADGALVAVRVEAGRSHPIRIEASGRRTPLTARYSHIEHLDAADGRVVMLAGAADAAMGVVAGDGQDFEVLSEGGFDWPAGHLSQAEGLRFPTSGGEEAHLWYYPPTHADCSVPEGELPPLILRCHGGPTAMNGDALDPRVQFWTSRGFAFADLNYRGSTGFGRAYRQSLAGNWGVKDVEDSVRAVAQLAALGLADWQRAAVSGSSAGGFTALAAVAFRQVFRACSVQYGISELETAMTDTHRFEARYGDSLLGPWPEARDLYRARSPLHAAAQIRAPVLFFQGLKDRVVLPDQTERMQKALRANKIPSACLSFAEEGHGFRRADTLRRVLGAELSFYAQVFDLAPADPLTPLDLGAGV